MAIKQSIVTNALIKSKGIKYDQEKPRLDLLSAAALAGIGGVLGYGSRKYASDNWRAGMDWRRLVGAAYRHLGAFQDGEDLDPESGLPHIDHLACCVMFLSEYQKKNIGHDDRYKAVIKSGKEKERKNGTRRVRKVASKTRNRKAGTHTKW